MDTRFCPDCGLIVTMENGMDVLGQLRHRACVQRWAMNIIGDVFCGTDEEVRVAVRGVKRDWNRFVELLCFVANKLATGTAPAVPSEQQRFLDVLFEKFVLPRFDAATQGISPEQAKELGSQFLT